MLAAGDVDSDHLWDLVPILYLSKLEAPVAIIALCSPSINSLVMRAVKARSLSSLFTSRNISTTGASSKGSYSERKNNSGISRDDGFSKLQTSTVKLRNGKGHSTATAVAEEDEGFDERPIPLGSIGVSREVEVARSAERSMV